MERISLKEAAQRLGVDIRSIYEFIGAGELHAWRQERSIVVDADEADGLRPDDDGLAGVREPRDPPPRSGASTAALPLPDQ